MAIDLSSYIASQSSPTSQSSSSSSSASSSSSSSSGTASDIASGVSSYQNEYQTFLTLLTTQLKNQDPSSPMDPNAFTTELVQMTGVQQQLVSNQLLQQLVNASPSSAVGSSVNLIGQTVTATSATATLANGSATWSYNLPSTAANATLSISNSAGQVVWTGTAPNFAQGNSSFTWNGQNSAGQQQANGGAYTLSIAATDTNGATITPTISIQGKATSVQTVAGAATVTVNGTPVPVADVTAVAGS